MPNKVAVPFGIPTSHNGSSCFTSSTDLGNNIGVLDLGHCNRCVVVVHCCFNLHFHDDI